MGERREAGNVNESYGRAITQEGTTARKNKDQKRKKGTIVRYGRSRVQTKRGGVVKKPRYRGKEVEQLTVGSKWLP